MIKKIFGYLVSWTFFWMGDVVAKVMHLLDIFGHLYPIYNKLMNWSINVQDWAGNKSPWMPFDTSMYEEDENEAFRCQFWKNDV